MFGRQIFSFIFVVSYSFCSVGATNNRPAVRWNDQTERDDFVSRYERITAATDDYTVFRSNLPGKYHNSPLTIYLLVPSAVNLGKQFGSRSGPTKCRA